MSDALTLETGIRNYIDFILFRALSLREGEVLHLLKVPPDAIHFMTLFKEQCDLAGIIIDETSVPALGSLVTRAIEGDAFLVFDCTCAGLYEGRDPLTLISGILEEDLPIAPLWSLLSRNIARWTMIAVPTPLWAKQRFPTKSVETGIELLWNEIIDICKIPRGEPSYAAWDNHAERRMRAAAYLQERNFHALRFRDHDTDLTVALADGYRWLGPRFITQSGLHFIPNVPMNEIFTAPHRLHVDGAVCATRPILVNGLLIESMRLVFKNGKVVSARAERGQELLDAILTFDPGADRLGEAALVPDYQGEANDIHGIYYATLYDENAGSHLALGRAYRTSIANDLDDAAFLEAGGNLSDLHIDFTIGSPTLSVDGISANGQSISLLRNNQWIVSP